MKKRPTLRDIAAKCGVSRTLVSVVLNGKEGKISCSEACRQKIRETARQMGYAPNCLARSMSSGRSPVVAVMLHLDVNDLFSGSYDYFNDL
ncbi:MAG: LacI family DNA-binding transcriptional regulator, partial [Lentisphaeria bacterium]|nr:LacI family DNA-binding transcriptional regulator [Lentisphaeria bacterium]